METITMIPNTPVPARRTASLVHASRTIGAMPPAATSGSLCTWSHVATDVTKNRMTAAAFQARTIVAKAYGNRRLGEPAST